MESTKKLVITKEEPKLKKLVDELEKTNPCVKFVWSYEYSKWIDEWNFREPPTPDIMLKLIASLDIHKSSLIDAHNFSISKSPKEIGGYDEIDG